MPGPRRLAAAVLVAVLCGAAPAMAAPPARTDTARQIMAPGNFGGLPLTDESSDQLGLYDALTLLRDRVTDQDVDRLFIPLDLRPIGTARAEDTGRPGVRLLYDDYGIPHVYGRTRAGVMFGAGWTAARDRGLLLQLGRRAARAAVADVPGLDAFDLLTGGHSYVPSAEAEALVHAQRDLLVRAYGEEGRQILRDAAAFADGINAHLRRAGSPEPPFTVNDVIAITALIGSQFGQGGGEEARNADLLAKLRAQLGFSRGTAAWSDVMLADDPETPMTTRRRFPYGPLTGGPVRGSVVPDPGSLQEVPDPTEPPDQAPQSSGEASPSRLRSNFLLVDRRRSATHGTLGVMGPQLGYNYPPLLHQIGLHGPGIEAQGVAVAGLELYLLIGRTRDYAWSLTTSSADNRDVFAERLCEPDGSPPTRASTHYVLRGQCRPMRVFDAGLLDGAPLTFRMTVHGPVVGTFAAGGRPYALARQRSTYGREALSLAALKGMTEGRAQRPKDFFGVADRLEFTFNWGYQSRDTIAFYSSGRLPVRSPGLDRRLPTLGTGGFDWRGFLSQREHPQDVGGPGGVLLNWNNAAAPGFMHGDEKHAFGPVYRVQMLDRLPRKAHLRDVVAVMNRAATEDFRATFVWPVISAVLRTGPGPDARTQRAAQLLDAWARAGAPRLDRDGDGMVDEPAAAIMDTVFRHFADTVMRPVFGPLLSDLRDIQTRDAGAQDDSSSWGNGWYSYVVKDLRALLGRPVTRPFNLRYCGGGALAACRLSLWTTLREAVDELAAGQGPEPAAWRVPDARIGFQPGILPATMRWTNRPTYQQVLELAHRPRTGLSAGPP